MMLVDQALKPAMAKMTDEMSGVLKLNDASNCWLPFFKAMSHK